MDPSLDEVWRSRARSLLSSEPHGAHLPDDAWLALAEGRAVPGAAGGALEHLARCAECRDILRAVQLLRTGRQSIDGPTGRGLEIPRSASRWPWAAAVAAMLIAVGGIGVVTSRPATVGDGVAVAPGPGAPPSLQSAVSPTSPAPTCCALARTIGARFFALSA